MDRNVIEARAKALNPGKPNPAVGWSGPSRVSQPDLWARVQAKNAAIIDGGSSGPVAGSPEPSPVEQPSNYSKSELDSLFAEARKTAPTEPSRPKSPFDAMKKRAASVHGGHRGMCTSPDGGDNDDESRSASDQSNDSGVRKPVKAGSAPLLSFPLAKTGGDVAGSATAATVDDDDDDMLLSVEDAPMAMRRGTDPGEEAMVRARMKVWGSIHTSHVLKSSAQRDRMRLAQNIGGDKPRRRPRAFSNLRGAAEAKTAATATAAAERAATASTAAAPPPAVPTVSVTGDDRRAIMGILKQSKGSEEELKALRRLHDDGAIKWNSDEEGDLPSSPAPFSSLGGDEIQALKRKTTMMRNHGKKRLKDIKKSKGHKVNRVAHVEGARPAAIGEDEEDEEDEEEDEGNAGQTAVSTPPETIARPSMSRDSESSITGTVANSPFRQKASLSSSSITSQTPAASSSNDLDDPSLPAWKRELLRRRKQSGDNTGNVSSGRAKFEGLIRRNSQTSNTSELAKSPSSSRLASAASSSASQDGRRPSTYTDEELSAMPSWRREIILRRRSSRNLSTGSAPGGSGPSSRNNSTTNMAVPSNSASRQHSRNSSITSLGSVFEDDLDGGTGGGIAPQTPLATAAIPTFWPAHAASAKFTKAFSTGTPGKLPRRSSSEMQDSAPAAVAPATPESSTIEETSEDGDKTPSPTRKHPAAAGGIASNDEPRVGSATPTSPTAQAKTAPAVGTLASRKASLFGSSGSSSSGSSSSPTATVTTSAPSSAEADVDASLPAWKRELIARRRSKNQPAAAPLAAPAPTAQRKFSVQAVAPVRDSTGSSSSSSNNNNDMPPISIVAAATRKFSTTTAPQPELKPLVRGTAWRRKAEPRQSQSGGAGSSAATAPNTQPAVLNEPAQEPSRSGVKLGGSAASAEQAAPSADEPAWKKQLSSRKGSLKGLLDEADEISADELARMPPWKREIVERKMRSRRAAAAAT